MKFSLFNKRKHYLFSDQEEVTRLTKFYLYIRIGDKVRWFCRPCVKLIAVVDTPLDSSIDPLFPFWVIKEFAD